MRAQIELNANQIAGGLGILLPANVQMLLDAHAADKALWWQTLLFLRLPLQALLILWIWKTSQPHR